MAEQHQQMQQQHQAQHITAQILNVQGGVATLDDSVPVQIMMPAGVVMEQHHQVQQEQQIQVPQHVQEMQEVIQEAVGSATTQVVQEDPKLTNKKELSKQWKSLCKRAKQWCSMHDDSVPNFVMMYLDENRLVWEGPDHMESFISDESVISAFLRTAALSESLIGMEKRGVDEMQDVAPRPAKKQKKAETPSTSKKGMTDDEVIASILEKPEAVPESAAGDEGAGADGDDSDGDNVPSQTTDTDQPSQSTSEGPTQSGEGDVLSQVIESVIKDWAPGQGPPPTSQEGEEETGDASQTKMKVLIYDHLTTERGGNLSCTCNVCYKQFPNLRFLKAHLKLHPSDAVWSSWKGKKKWKMHTCDVCWRSFYLKANFITHKSTAIHKVNVSRKRKKKQNRFPAAGPHKCGHCEKEFQHMYKLQQHLNSVHLGLKPHQCKDCNAKFVNRGDLNRHVNQFHGNKTREMTVNNDGRLVLAEERKHVCHVCNRRFRSNGDLVRHVRIHTGEKPFQCGHCEKAFAHKSDLNKHMRIHTGERPYGCPYCAKAFKDLGNMKAHCRTHTKEQFKCQICKIEFATPRDLRLHHWTHAGTVSPAEIGRPRAKRGSQSQQPLVPSQWSAGESQSSEVAMATATVTGSGPSFQIPVQSVVQLPVQTGMQPGVVQVSVPGVQVPIQDEVREVSVPGVEQVLVTNCNLTIDTNAFNQLLQHT